MFQTLPPPVNVAIMETPAGFELNSSDVAGRVAGFIEHRLQNYKPNVTVVPARRNDTEFGTNNFDILRPLLNANYIFMGPGSPSYTVRHLTGSLAWEIIRARHRLGACLAFSSSAAIAIGLKVLPVYEIYKVGEHDRSIRCTSQRIQRRVEKCLIPRRLDLPADTLVRINVRDLANTDHFTPAFNQLVEECRRRRWCRQITAIAGTNEIHSIGADEWPRNNATDVVVVNQVTRNIAESVKPLKSERLFVTGNLEDRIGRRIDDGFAGRHVLLAALGNARRAG